MDLSQLDDAERERWEWYALHGLHSFLFVDHLEGSMTPGDVVTALQAAIPDEGTSRDEPAVLAASEFVGAFGLFVHLWAPRGGLALLQDLIAGPIRDLGLRCEYATQATSYQDGRGRVYTLKIKKCDVVAVTRIWAEPGRALELLPTLSRLDGFEGAATVFGAFDVLLVLEGEGYEDVADVALHRLHGLDGVARSETSFADFRRYPGLHEGKERKAAETDAASRAATIRGVRGRMGLPDQGPRRDRGSKR